jgi:hypothetical protein
MKSRTFITELDLQAGFPTQDESLESIWAEFEQTGSISVFLAYSQRARGLKASFDRPEALSIR